MPLPKIPKPSPIPHIPKVKIPHIQASAPQATAAVQKPLKAAKAPSTHLPWLGNKTETPRPPGARIQSHLKELQGSEYPTVKW